MDCTRKRHALNDAANNTPVHEHHTTQFGISTRSINIHLVISKHTAQLATTYKDTITIASVLIQLPLTMDLSTAYQNPTYIVLGTILVVGLGTLMLYPSDILRWLKLKRYQYEVTYSLYMMTPTEKFIFSAYTYHLPHLLLRIHPVLPPPSYLSLIHI